MEPVLAKLLETKKTRTGTVVITGTPVEGKEKEQFIMTFKNNDFGIDETLGPFNNEQVVDLMNLFQRGIYQTIATNNFFFKQWHRKNKDGTLAYDKEGKPIYDEKWIFGEEGAGPSKLVNGKWKLKWNKQKIQGIKEADGLNTIGPSTDTRKIYIARWYTNTWGLSTFPNPDGAQEVYYEVEPEKDSKKRQFIKEAGIVDFNVAFSNGLKKDAFFPLVSPSGKRILQWEPGYGSMTWPLRAVKMSKTNKKMELDTTEIDKKNDILSKEVLRLLKCAKDIEDKK